MFRTLHDVVCTLEYQRALNYFMCMSVTRVSCKLMHIFSFACICSKLWTNCGYDSKVHNTLSPFVHFSILLYISAPCKFVSYHNSILLMNNWYKCIIEDNSYLRIQAYAEVLGHAPRQNLMYTSVHKRFLFIAQHMWHMVHNSNEWTYAARPLLSCLK
jgi:hypothetical protein